MSRRWILAGLGSALLLSGCFAVDTTQVPMADTYPYSTQRKMQAAHHWDVLAANEAQGMLRSRALRGKALYIDPNGENSTFAQSYQELLTSRLVSQGALVRTAPGNTARVTYDVQTVDHRARRDARAPRGTWTALSAGIAVATLPINHWEEPALALIPVAGLADLFSGSWESVSSHEVVITTKVTEDDRVLYSSSNLYYINGDDAGQYASSRPLPVSNTW